MPARFALSVLGTLAALVLAGCEFLSASGGGVAPTGAASPQASGSAAQQQTTATAQAGNETVASPGDSQSAEVKLQILDYDAIAQLIARHQGKVVVLDCWSTSCEPCMKEFPGLVALHRKYKDRVACISLSFDYEGIGKPEDKVPLVLDFLKQQGATFDNILSSTHSDTLYTRLDFGSIPAVFVYDQQGQLKKRFDDSTPGAGGGHFTYAEVEALVLELLAAEN